MIPFQRGLCVYTRVALGTSLRLHLIIKWMSEKAGWKGWRSNPFFTSPSARSDTSLDTESTLERSFLGNNFLWTCSKCAHRQSRSGLLQWQHCIKTVVHPKCTLLVSQRRNASRNLRICLLATFSKQLTWPARTGFSHFEWLYRYSCDYPKQCRIMEETVEPQSYTISLFSISGLAM